MVVSKTTGGGSIPSGSAILDYGVMVSTSDFESGSSGSSPDSSASCQVDREVRYWSAKQVRLVRLQHLTHKMDL